MSNIETIWSDKIVQRVLELWADGRNVPEVRRAINREMGLELTLNQIRSKLRRLGHSEQHRGIVQVPSWSEEHRKIAVEMFNAGATAREIGARVGRTRQTVNSMLQRMGLFRSKEWMQAQRVEAGAALSRQRKGDPDPTPDRGSAQGKKQSAQSVNMAWPSTREGGPILIADLTRQTCRWVCDVAPVATYCGAQIGPDSAYCNHHHAIAYVAGSNQWYKKMLKTMSRR